MVRSWESLITIVGNSEKYNALLQTGSVKNENGNEFCITASTNGMLTTLCYKWNDFAFFGTSSGVGDCDWRKIIFNKEMVFRFCMNDSFLSQSQTCRQHGTNCLSVFVPWQENSKSASTICKEHLRISFHYSLPMYGHTHLCPKQHPPEQKTSQTISFIWFLDFIKKMNRLLHIKKKTKQFVLQNECCAPERWLCVQDLDSRF